jgi:hypothetical protein
MDELVIQSSTEYIAEYSEEKIGKPFSLSRTQMKKIENKGREEMIEILYGSSHTSLKKEQ